MSLRRMKHRRWHSRVLAMLARNKWVSVQGVLDAYISTYGTKFAPTRGELATYIARVCEESDVQRVEVDGSIPGNQVGSDEYLATNTVHLTEKPHRTITFYRLVKE